MRLIDRITRLRGLDLCGSEIDAVRAAERAYWAAQDLGCQEHANELAKRMVRIHEIERNHGMEGGE